MKAFRSRILRTLQTFHQVGPTKPGNGRVLQLEPPPPDELYNSPPSPVKKEVTKAVLQEEELEERGEVAEAQPELPDTPVSPILAPTEEESSDADKENVGPSKRNKDDAVFHTKIEDLVRFEEISPKRPDLGCTFPSYRRPDLNSSTLFDPNLLAAFRQAVSDHTEGYKDETRTRSRCTEEVDLIEAFERPAKVARVETEDYTCGETDPLSGFEVKCPIGGKECVILYTTSLRGVRKTFEECTKLRFLLQNLGVSFHERDISMDLGYREELWQVLGFRAIPPRLFIKGRYVGGAEEIAGLHEAGRFRAMVKGFVVGCDRVSCEACGGMKFMLCLVCNGSHSLYDKEEEIKVPCLGCNENGLVACPLCS